MRCGGRGRERERGRTHPAPFLSWLLTRPCARWPAAPPVRPRRGPPCPAPGSGPRSRSPSAPARGRPVDGKGKEGRGFERAARFGRRRMGPPGPCANTHARARSLTSLAAYTATHPLRHHGIEKRTLYRAPAARAASIEAATRAALPSKSRAHWSREQVATTAVRRWGGGMVERGAVTLCVRVCVSGGVASGGRVPRPRGHKQETAAVEERKKNHSLSLSTELAHLFIHTHAHTLSLLPLPAPVITRVRKHTGCHSLSLSLSLSLCRSVSPPPLPPPPLPSLNPRAACPAAPSPGAPRPPAGWPPAPPT